MLRVLSGSGGISSTRLTWSRSGAHSLRTRAMSRGLKMRAADVGTDLRKKLRSRTFMARLMGGRNWRDMSSSPSLSSAVGCAGRPIGWAMAYLFEEGLVVRA